MEQQQESSVTRKASLLQADITTDEGNVATSSKICRAPIGTSIHHVFLDRYSERSRRWLYWWYKMFIYSQTCHSGTDKAGVRPTPFLSSVEADGASHKTPTAPRYQ